MTGIVRAGFAMICGGMVKAKDTARLMVGQPPYEAYLAHMALHHADQTPMTRVEFFRNREAARFSGAGGGKCC